MKEEFNKIFYLIMLIYNSVGQYIHLPQLRSDYYYIREEDLLEIKADLEELKAYIRWQQHIEQFYDTPSEMIKSFDKF